MNLLQLPAEIVMQIISHLNFREQIVLSGVCSYLKDFLRDFIWQPKIQQIFDNFTWRELETLTTAEFRQFFAVVACILQKLSTCHLKKDDWSYYFQFEMPNLVELYCVIVELTDEHVNLIAQNCKQLQNLSIYSHKITGVHISKLKALKKLDVSGCKNFNVENLQQILSTCKLTHLNMKGTAVQDAVILSRLNYNELTHLTMNFAQISDELNENSNCFDKLQKLVLCDLEKERHYNKLPMQKCYQARELIIHEPYDSRYHTLQTFLKELWTLEVLWINDELLEANAIFETICQLQHLKILHLISFFLLTPVWRLQQIIEKCLHLKHIYFDTINIEGDEAVMEDILQILKWSSHQQRQRNEILTLHVKINEKDLQCILEHNLFKEQTNLKLQQYTPKCDEISFCLIFLFKTRTITDVLK